MHKCHTLTKIIVYFTTVIHEIVIIHIHGELCINRPVHIQVEIVFHECDVNDDRPAQ